MTEKPDQVRAARVELLKELLSAYQYKVDNAPRYTPPKGGTTSRAVYQTVLDDLDTRLRAEEPGA